MKETAAYIKATVAANKSRKSLAGVRKYKSVDGRTYLTEKEAKPLPLRKKVIFHQRCLEKLSVADIYRMEVWLSTSDLTRPLKGPYKPLSSSDSARIKHEYSLTYNQETRHTEGDKEQVFDVLCGKFPTATQFKKYNGILYAMRYGNAPCTTISGEVDATWTAVDQ